MDTHLPVRKSHPTSSTRLEPQASSQAAVQQLRDLIAEIIGGEDAHYLADELLAEFPEPALLSSAHPEEMLVVGLELDEAVRLRAALDMAMRINAMLADRPSIKGAADAAALLIPRMGHLEQEHLVVVLLTAKNSVIDFVEVHRGTLSSSLVRPAEIFRPAIRRNAARILVAHNHPSGVCEPSPDDVSITRDLVQLGEMLDLEVIDHLVVSAEGYTSLREQRLGF